jgi:hypothetical protein
MHNSKVAYLKSPQIPAKKEFYEKYWFKAFLKLLGFICGRLPPLRSYIAKTAGGMLGRAHQNYKNGNLIEVYQICADGLKKFFHKTDSLGHYDWWEFMKYGVCAADQLDDSEKKEALILIAENGVRPFEGQSVAFSFCIFSRWKYKEKNYDAAVSFAKQAVEADASYAEGHALIGWYKLFIDQSDPRDNFIAAINCDKEYLNKIINAPEMANFPNIISDLRKVKLLKKESRP